MKQAPPDRSYSPPDIAKRYGVNVRKVLDWIRDESLHAIDVSYHPGVGKPRWRITPEALAEFEASRSNRTTPEAAPMQPRRRQAVKGYFRD